MDDNAFSVTVRRSGAAAQFTDCSCHAIPPGVPGACREICSNTESKALPMACRGDAFSIPRSFSLSPNAAALRRNLRTSSPPFTASRWRTFWTTTPPLLLHRGGGDFPSADTGRQRAGTVRQLADHAKVGRTSIRCWESDKRPSVRSVNHLVENLGSDFPSMLAACEGWYFIGQKKSLPPVFFPGGLLGPAGWFLGLHRYPWWYQ